MSRLPKASLEASLGYKFRNPLLLKQALTPPSSGLQPNNQRLEFLGDAILQFCLSRLAFEAQPTWEEGALSKLRGMLVCTDSLRNWAEDIGLNLQRGPRSPKKAPVGEGKPLADAMEALLAAIYLDAEQAGENPTECVLRVLKTRFEATLLEATPGMWENLDSKTTLQERAAAASLPPPHYDLIQRSGPDHQPRFKVRVEVGALWAESEAGSLKKAQTEAARLLLGQLADA